MRFLSSPDLKLNDKKKQAEALFDEVSLQVSKCTQHAAWAIGSLIAPCIRTFPWGSGRGSHGTFAIFPRMKKIFARLQFQWFI
jgi:hypothetical protein